MGFLRKFSSNTVTRLLRVTCPAHETPTRRGYRSNRETRNLSRLGSNFTHPSIWHNTEQLPGDSSSTFGSEQRRPSEHAFCNPDDHMHGEQRKSVPGVVAQADRPVSPTA